MEPASTKLKVFRTSQELFPKLTLPVFAVCALALLRAESCGSTVVDCHDSRITMHLAPGESQQLIEDCWGNRPSYYSPEQYTVIGSANWPDWLLLTNNSDSRKTLIQVTDGAPTGNSADVILNITPLDVAKDLVAAHQIQLSVEVTGVTDATNTNNANPPEWQPRITADQLQNGYIAILGGQYTLMAQIDGEMNSAGRLRYEWSVDPALGASSGPDQVIAIHPTTPGQFVVKLAVSDESVTRTASKEIEVAGLVPVIRQIGDQPFWQEVDWSASARETIPISKPGEKDRRSFAWSAQYRDGSHSTWKDAGRLDCDVAGIGNYVYGCRATHFQYKVNLTAMLDGLPATSSSTFMLVTIPMAPDATPDP